MDEQQIDITYLKEKLANLKSRLDRIEDFLTSFRKTTFPLSDSSDPDELFTEAVGVTSRYDRISASILQRHLNIGYARSARIPDQLVQKELISSSDGTSKPREVYADKVQTYLVQQQKKD